jgi:hypothetical protein
VSAQDIDGIFDAIVAASHIVHKQDAARKKREQIRDVTSRTCGNCDLWMTCYCDLEKNRGLFRTASSTGCRDFKITPSSQALHDQFAAELAEIVKTP